jgi:hypothetical protein
MTMSKLEIDIDIDKDVLGFNPVPPKRTFWDYFPTWLMALTRRAFSFPQPTKREHWFLALFFVRGTLTTIVELHDSYTKPKPPEVPEFLSKDPDDPYRWS